MSRHVAYGAELDGDVLRVVGIDDGRVVAYERIDAVGDRARLRNALRRGEPLVAWASPGVVVRRLPVAAGATRNVAPVLREAIDALSTGWAELPGAGGVWAHDESVRDTATVGVVTDPAAETALEGTNAKIVVAPLTLQHDGLHLAIRRSCAELTLVRDGVAVASRQLRPGGIPGAVPTDGEVLSPRRYVAAIARDVARTLEMWDHDTPDEVWLHGEGATLPHVPSFMQSIGLTARPAPVWDDIDTSSIPADERLAAYGALQAALVDRDEQPLITLDGVRADRGSRRGSIADPYAGFQGVVADTGNRGFATPSSTVRPEGAPTGLGAAIIVTAVAALVAGVAWWRASVGLESARVHLAAAVDDRDAAQAQLDYANELQVAAAEIRRLSPTTSPGWDAVMSTLLATLPAEPSAESVLIITESGTARAVVTVPEGPGVADDWSTALSAFGPVTVASSGSLLRLTVALPTVEATDIGVTPP